MMVATLSRTMVYVRPKVFRVYGRLNEQGRKEWFRHTLFFLVSTFFAHTTNLCFLCCLQGHTKYISKNITWKCIHIVHFSPWFHTIIFIYSTHPRIRTHDFGVKADLVLIHQVVSDRSALRCSSYVLKLCFKITTNNMLLEVYWAYFIMNK